MKPAIKSPALSTVIYASKVVAKWIMLLCEDLEWIDRTGAYMPLREVLHIQTRPARVTY